MVLLTWSSDCGAVWMIRGTYPRKGKIISLPKSVSPGYGADTSSYLMGKEVISLSKSGREVDHSPLYCADVKEWNCLILAWAGKILPLPLTQDIGGCKRYSSREKVRSRRCSRVHRPCKFLERLHKIKNAANGLLQRKTTAVDWWRCPSAHAVSLLICKARCFS